MDEPLVTPPVDRRPLWTFSFSGAAIGLLFFVVVALEATLFFGGFTGTSLARGIFGNHGLDTFQARGLIAFGIMITVMGTASMFVILGALAGWTLFVLTHGGESGRTLAAEGEAALPSKDDEA